MQILGKHFRLMLKKVKGIEKVLNSGIKPITKIMMLLMLFKT